PDSCGALRVFGGSVHSRFPQKIALVGTNDNLRTRRPEAMIRDLLILGLFPAAMVFAAVSDLLTMTISNRLSIALALGFFAVAALVGMPLADVGYHVLASL